MSRADGVEFASVLGTGSGSSTGPSVDPGRCAIVAVWRDADAHDAFVRVDPLGLDAAAEHWWCRVRVARAHGRWSDWTPEGAGADRPGPVVVLTRATIRWGALPAFLAASHGSRHAARDAAGARAVIGVGDVPLRRLGTISVWDDADEARRFAETSPHARLESDAQAGGWFAESLFAWLEPLASGGTWDGADPVAFGPPTQDR